MYIRVDFVGLEDVFKALKQDVQRHEHEQCAASKAHQQLVPVIAVQCCQCRDTFDTCHVTYPYENASVERCLLATSATRLVASVSSVNSV